MEHNQQGPAQGRGRRGHFNRGRRPDRRGPSGQESRESREPRASQPSESHAPRAEHVNVEQIMRDIRSRIAQRHGIDLSAPQIQELAARRLEAILDPRNVNPSLLDQLRKAAGERPARTVAAAAAEPAYTFEDSTLYESNRGLLTTIRRLLNPILKLFFNPNPLVHALNAQARLNAEQAVRESERDERQAEWNALQYELLRRVVTESARLSVEVQALTLRVESLAARVDFADRRVRILEATPAPAPRQGGRPPQQEPRALPTPDVTPVVAGDAPAAPAAPIAADASSPDGQRRRRRRRRGRRSGTSFGEGGPNPSEQPGTQASDAEEFDDSPDDDASGSADGDTFSLQPAVAPEPAVEPVIPPAAQHYEEAAAVAAPEPSASDASSTEPTS